MFKKINPYIFGFNLTGLVIWLVTLILTLSFLLVNRQVPSFIIRFSSVTGYTFFGSWWLPLLELLLGLILIVLNTFLSVILFNRHRRLAYFLALTSGLVSLLILLHIGVIISVN